ncbi:hypothetical protein BACCAP_04694 [Pseudoflavonifractor capillosus ATCC 29799]|uniref:Uncharacterized protein n=1 Tax=Pseudoflavonifractor capillosus ATCC 29799 TaxID=411467 RepID=A6P2G3_9FIRM|nr:hypothetical protein BACCAP_04694 [Pseudoflavonifractor capillosus ATCC 29799]
MRSKSSIRVTFSASHHIYKMKAKKTCSKNSVRRLSP